MSWRTRRLRSQGRCLALVDVEPILLTKIATALRTAFPGGIFITGESSATPPSLPCVAIVEISNTTYTRSLDSSQRENHANLVYEIQIYSNKTVGKKTECRAIAAVIDEVMLGLNFTRTMLEPITNLADASVYRMIARYKAVISTDYRIYRK